MAPAYVMIHTIDAALEKREIALDCICSNAETLLVADIFIG